MISFKTSDLNASGKVEFYTHLVATTTPTDLLKIPISLVASIQYLKPHDWLFSLCKDNHGQ